MKRTGNDQLACRTEDVVATDHLYEADLERASAVYFERRGKMWAKFKDGDWRIAVAVYVIFSIIAFAIL